MCYTDDARPPLPPVSGGSIAASGDLTLEASDGNRFMAYAAQAAQPDGAGVVILPDVRGLFVFYKELADQFATAGIHAVAFDYFGRTAETDNRDEGFAFRPHVEQTTPEGVDADVAAAIAHVRSPDGGAAERVFTVGFCFGGAASWRQSATQPGLAGAIGFYGVPERVRPYLDRMAAPLLLLVAGADFTPVEEFERFDGELSEAGVPHTMVVYDGAPHSFFDRTFHEHAAACEDAWKQILGFIGDPPTRG
ncbi:MAG TPA: dienelactone hydrolase family protein [Vicinamibacterales bacterium]|nr:dienelactone hydrolase [Chloroflexota bacterium]HQX83229.1 dienelactone hydrolase family protein [Vicinamibacterales bacterium]HQZ89309.1 dienelactone hydrolase family protein [Thermomicrobiales bacterium]